MKQPGSKEVSLTRLEQRSVKIGRFYAYPISSMVSEPGKPDHYSAVTPNLFPANLTFYSEEKVYRIIDTQRNLHLNRNTDQEKIIKGIVVTSSKFRNNRLFIPMNRLPRQLLIRIKHLAG